MKPFNQLTKSELYGEYIELKKQNQWLTNRLTQQHEEFLPPEIRDELQELNGYKHNLTVENRRLKSQVNDLTAELKETQSELEDAYGWVN